MAILRIKKTNNYTVMSNYHFKEKDMSLKAKGLLSLMLSLPEDWDYSIDGLAKLSKDGKDSVMSALAELEKFNYLIRTQTKDEDGKFAGYDYDVYEQPYTEKPFTEKPSPDFPKETNTLSNKDCIERKTVSNKDCVSVPRARRARPLLLRVWNRLKVSTLKNNFRFTRG